MILEVQDIQCGYGKNRIIHGLEFYVQPGELVAILGPNGVGKSTLLKCLNNIYSATSGVVLVEGRELQKMAPEEIGKVIGYVPQKNESCRLSVFDAVLLGRKPHIRWRASSRDIKIVNATIESLGLTHLSLRYIDELSGGELQKVSIARALVQEPKLLLFDEPTSALDLKNQMQILSTIRHIVDGHGIGAIMTMHDLNTALRFADRYLLLKDGKIHDAGQTTDIKAETIEEVYGLAVSIQYYEEIPMIIPSHV